MKVDEIREKYLRFYESKDHPIVSSDSLVPQNDPSVLFTGAGMNQFKEYFLGVKKDLNRATSSQKCLRTGDLEEVGRTSYHHSFFEMLGNFSFGNYFKREAILWAWEFLTQELNISKDRLRISVHKDDEEAYKIWTEEVGLPEEWVMKLGDKGNFWPANAPKDGPNGPCGPCSEIYYDIKPELEGDIESDNGKYSEIWNLVFTQYNRKGVNDLEPLENKNIDTGMGLERLACVLQGKETNYEIDSFIPIQEIICKLLDVKKANISKLKSLYAICDHIRALVFCIHDGVVPSNEGRGYVVRKILRRALWYGHEIAPSGKVSEPFLCNAVQTVADVMKKGYPELQESVNSISASIRVEEERFLKTLSKGLSRLQDHMAELKQANQQTLPAAQAFELYDTFGFPFELTEIICGNEFIQVDELGFNQLMDEQRNRSKESSQMSDEIFTKSGLEQIPADTPATVFLGYETLESSAHIAWSSLDANGKGIIILDQTPFYAESGGQAGDRGILKTKEVTFNVLDTKKLDSFFVHHVELVDGNTSEVTPAVTAQVNIEYREDVMRNHTATHLLHAALQSLLGKEVRQLGSYVGADRLRFDFSFGRALKPTEIENLESLVQEQILKNVRLVQEEKDIETAKRDGAMAFFGDKYGDTVRVVTVPGFSMELCGGTHCHATGDIGTFIILADSSVASGVRRIEALTGREAIAYMSSLRSRISEISGLLRVPAKDIEVKIQKLIETSKNAGKAKKASGGNALNIKSLTDQASEKDGVKVLYHHFNDYDKNDLREISDKLKSQSSKTVYFLSSFSEGKISTVLGMSADLKKTSLNLKDVFQSFSEKFELKGGGRPDFIQAGGANPELLKNQEEFIQSTLMDYVQSKVGA